MSSQTKLGVFNIAQVKDIFFGTFAKILRREENGVVKDVFLYITYSHIYLNLKL